MSRLRFKISMSLDGYVAGPSQSLKDPIGVGGMRLHDWVFPLKIFRELQGMGEGGEVNASTAVVEGGLQNVGATIMGRNMFGGGKGPWDVVTPWNGWWGRNPPFHHPVFVLTTHPRGALALDAGTTFHFVTDGIESAFAQAKRAADGKDVMLAGGAHVAREYLSRGLVDEMEISLVPILLGSGEHLFQGVGNDLHGMSLVRTVATPEVTHLKFARP